MGTRNTTRVGMSKARKTKAEKIESGYRLQNFRLQVEKRQEAKDASEFGYLANEYVIKDLTKTGIFTLIILGLLIIAKLRLG